MNAMEKERNSVRIDLDIFIWPPKTFGCDGGNDLSGLVYTRTLNELQELFNQLLNLLLTTGTNAQ
jgi:hypothetical protein